MQIKTKTSTDTFRLFNSNDNIYMNSIISTMSEVLVTHQRRVTLMEQELITLPEQPGSFLAFSEMFMLIGI